jgi:hypothetical protein
MQQAQKNRFSAKISALLVAVLTLGSLPLAQISQAAPMNNVQFETTSATVTEGNNIMLTIIADSNTTSNISYSVSGTATTGEDFVFNNAPSVVAGAIAMSGQSLQIPLTITDDSDNTEGPETVIITLTDINGSFVQLGANTTFTVTINDNTGLPFINFTSETSSNLEDQAGIITAQLSRVSAQDVTFQWSADNAGTTALNIETVLGGNTFPADFTNAPIAPIDVVIPAGQLTATIDLGIQDDNLYEPAEAVQAVITGTLTNVQFGTSLSHTYVIYDNDTPNVQFASAGSPEELRAPKELVKELRETMDVSQKTSFGHALEEADVIYMTRVQKEWFEKEGKLDEYERLRLKFIMTGSMADKMKKDAIIMHPLPRVGEILQEVDDNPRAMYFDQMRSGLYVRMALLKSILVQD